jgi:recombination protein RecT
MDDSLELYQPESDVMPVIERQVRDRIIRERALEFCDRFPHAFCLRPSGSVPPFEKGSWGKYPFDESMDFWINAAHPEALSFYKKISQEEREVIMAQELTRKEDVGIKQMLAANIKAIKTVLPKHMTPERMMRIAYTAISRSPMLARCTPVSLLNAVIEASMLGLEVNSPLGQASMVPFYNSKTKQYEAQLIPEYKGKIELAYRSGMVRSFQAHPVFEKDDFSYSYGLNPNLTHKPAKVEDRGGLVAAYAVVNYINGGVDFEVIEEAEAMKAKAKSSGAQRDEKNNTDYSPWNTEDEPSMWMKTAVHRLFKRVPKSPEYMQIQRAQELSQMAESGEPQDFEFLNSIELPVNKIGDGKGEPEEEKQREEGSEPTGDPNPPQKEVKTDASTPLGEQAKTNMQKLSVLAKANPKLYEQACEEEQITSVESEAGAFLILKRADLISKRKVKK